MLARILAMGLFEWDESLQIASAHRLGHIAGAISGSLCSMIEEARGSGSAQVKRVRWQHGAEEIQSLHRIIVSSSRPAARPLEA
jgi:hypothetical protein